MPDLTADVRLEHDELLAIRDVTAILSYQTWGEFEAEKKRENPGGSWDRNMTDRLRKEWKEKYEQEHRFNAWWFKAAELQIQGLRNEQIRKKLGKAAKQVRDVLGPPGRPEEGSLARTAYSVQHAFLHLSQDLHYYDWLTKRLHGSSGKLAYSKLEDLIKEKGFPVRRLSWGYVKGAAPHSWIPSAEDGPKVTRVYQRVAHKGESLAAANRAENAHIIRFAFRSRVYLGETKWQGKWYKTHDALTDEETWKRSIANMDSKPRRIPEGLRFLDGKWAAGPDVESGRVQKAFKMHIEQHLSPRKIGEEIDRSDPTVNSWLKDRRFVKAGVISESDFKKAQKVKSHDSHLDETRKRRENLGLEILKFVNEKPLRDSEIARHLSLEVSNARRYISGLRNAGLLRKDKRRGLTPLQPRDANFSNSINSLSQPLSWPRRLD